MNTILCPTAKVQNADALRTFLITLDEIKSERTNMKRIICAAIKIMETDQVFYGHRHDQCFNSLNSQLSFNLNRQQIAKLEKIQGFVTGDGEFVDREQAFIIAKECGQIKDLSQTRGSTLYSEDLY